MDQGPKRAASTESLSDKDKIVKTGKPLNTNSNIRQQTFAHKPITTKIFNLKNCNTNLKSFEMTRLKSTIPLTNKYEVLTTDDMETEETNDATNATAEQTQTESDKKQKAYFPPLYVYTDEVKRITSFIKLNCPNTTIRHNLDYSTVKYTTIEDSRLILQFLNTRKMEFMTYADKKNQPAKILVRHIPQEYSEEEIMTDLIEKGIPVNRVNRFISRRGTEKIITSMVIINVPKSHQDKMYEQETICGISIRMEPFKKKDNSIPQCHNCLAFGHSSETCRRKPKCVKCGETHKTTECKAEPEAPANCANCKGQHKACYRGCPFYKNIVKQMQEQKRRKPANQQSTRYVQKQEDFPALPKRQATQPSSTNMKYSDALRSNENEEQEGASEMGKLTELADLIKQANVGHIIDSMLVLMRKVVAAKSDKEKATILLQGLSKLN